MPEFSKISKYVDQAGLEKDTAFFLAQLETVETEAVAMAKRVSTTLGTGLFPKGASGGSGISQQISLMKDMTLTTKQYEAVLSQLVPVIDKLTEAEKADLKALNDSYQAGEKLRSGVKETVKLASQEATIEGKIEAARSNAALAIARKNVQLKEETLLRNRLAKVQETEANSLQRAQALIDFYILKNKKLNLETEQGIQQSERYKNAIEKLNNFIIENADAETARIKNIGNYNQAAQIVVKSIEEESAKLKELIERRKELERTTVQGFGAKRDSGNTGGPDTTRNGGTTASAGGGTEFKAIATDAAVAKQQIADLDAEINKTRTTIVGFRRAADDLNLDKIAKNSVGEVQQLEQSLAALEKQGLGSSAAANELKSKISELKEQLYQSETASKAVNQIGLFIGNLNKELKNTKEGTAEYRKLRQEIILLNTISDSLNKTFTGTRAEFKALEESLRRIGDEFGVDSEEFKKFSDLVGNRKNDLGDLKAALNFKSSDTKGLDATLAGVQAITGAYGGYEAVLGLVGSKNEDLAQSMQKLQAITALVASVQSTVNALQTDGALIQGTLAVRAKALAAAQQLISFFTKEAAVSLGAQAVAAEATAVAVGETAVAEGVSAAATDANAVASAEAAVAMGEEAAASQALAAGLTETAVAEGAVASGASVMAGALAATGILALVAILAVGITKLIMVIKEWNAASESSKEANKELAASVAALEEATKSYSQALRASSDLELKLAKDRNDRLKAQGVTTQQSLALDKQVSDKRLNLAQQFATLYGVNANTVKKANDKVIETEGILLAAQETRTKLVQQTINKEDAAYKKKLEAIDENIKGYDNDNKAAKAHLEFQQGVYTELQDSASENAVIQNTINKQSADDRRKYELESARISAQAVIDNNNIILSNERSTLDQRVTALKENLTKQRDILNAENKAIQSDPTVSTTDKQISAEKTAEAIKKIEAESAKEISELKETYRLRDLAATVDIQKRLLDVVATSNDSIVKNEKATQELRLESLNKFNSARKAQLEVDFGAQLSTAGISDADIERIKQVGFFEIENKKITNAELLKLITDYNQNQLQLARDINKSLLDITKDYFQQEDDIRTKALKKINQDYQLVSNDRTVTYNQELEALNNLYANGKKSYQQYTEEKRKLDLNYNRDSLKLEIDKIEKALKAVGSAKETEKKLQKELDNLNNFQGPETDQQAEDRANRIAVLTDELEKVKSVVGEESELYKQLSDLKRKLSDGDVDNFEKNQEKIRQQLDNFKQNVDSVISAISGVGQGIAERQKQRLQDQIDDIDKREEAELKANENAQIADDKKAENKERIERRAQAQREALAERQKKIDRDTAIREKAISIFQIILATAVNVAKATTIPGKIQAAIAGAAQLAIAAAAPLPKFFMGKKKNQVVPGGYGVLNDHPDGRTQEVLEHSDGSWELVKGRNVVKEVKNTDTIHASSEEFFKMLNNSAMGTLSQMAMNYAERKEQVVDFDGIMDRVGSNIVDAINNKQENHVYADRSGMVNLHKWGANQLKYLEDQTNW